MRKHLEAGDLAGILGGLALSIIEIGGNGDDGLAHFPAEISFGGLLHLLKDEGRDLRRRVSLAAGLDPGVSVVAAHDPVGDQPLALLDHRVVKTSADQALDREDGVLWIGDGLTFGRLPDEQLAILGECDHRRRRPRSFGVFDHLGLPAFHYGDTGIGRTEIDADYLAGHVRLRSWRPTHASMSAAPS